MQKTIMLILGFALSLSFLCAGDFIIGTDDDTQNKVPLYGYANYGWTKFFYKADELQAAGFTTAQTIERIAFYVGNDQTNYETDNQMVYMGYFYDSQYSSTSYQNPAYHTLVYSGTVSWNGPGWQEIILDTPYSFDPTYGWNLEILWENHDGSRIGGPPNFHTTGTSFYSAVYKNGSSWSTSNGSRSRDYRPNIWLMSSPDAPPPPATAVLPLDAAIDVPLDTMLRWEHNGGMPNDYMLWVGTDNPPSNIVNALSLSETGYTLPQNLDYSTTYYWRVVPVNDIAPAMNCPIWSFTTMADPSIVDYPHLETFDGEFPPGGWTQWAGTLSDPISFTNGTRWVQDDWLNYAGDDKAAKINIWGSMSGYLISPMFNIPDENYVMKIDAAILKYGQTPEGTPPNYSATDDQFAILIGDGYSWEVADVVREYNNSGSEYVLNDIPMAGETITISLAEHTGHIRVAFFAGSIDSNDDNDYMLNNFWIGDADYSYPTPTVQMLTDESTGAPRLSWEPIPYARKYNLYKTNDPSTDYIHFKSISGSSYVVDPAENKAFFKITAE
ncbi:MAG: hypothetical protein PHX33_07005 [Candidatus Cloacimonetes bacterium]|nr:hypothetical protein [Candidatus Cloacimonadota bacterium]